MKLLDPSAVRQQIPPRGCGCGRDAVDDFRRELGYLKGLPLHETSVQWWPLTCARARNPSNFGSNIHSGLSKGSGMRRRRMAATVLILGKSIL